MRIVGKKLGKLFGKANSNRVGSCLQKSPVIISFAIAQSVELFIKGKRRYKNNINFICNFTYRRNRFQDS